MFRGLRQLALALIRERRVVMRVREVGFQPDRFREAVNRRAPIARLGGGQAGLIVRERIAAVSLDGATRQIDRAAGVVSHQRFARFADQPPCRVLACAQTRHFRDSAIVSIELQQRLRGEVRGRRIRVACRLNSLFVGPRLEEALDVSFLRGDG